MELISPAQRDKLFESFERDAFHLELRDTYGSAVEETPFARWKRGEPDERAWLQPWLSLMRRVTNSGKSVRRVRVISEPHSEYITWERSLTDLNIAAGEDIRWLPRPLLPESITWPLDGNDWWLFDDRLLAVGHFAEDGRVLGSEIVEDEGIVNECARLRDSLWRLALPHSEYKP